MLLASCVNTPINHNVFHNLCAHVARCSTSYVNWAEPNFPPPAEKSCTFIAFVVYLWDIHLANEKSTSSFNYDDMSLFNSGFSVWHNGTVSLLRELLSNVACAMDLRPYPHDTQCCSMYFTSFNFNSSQVRLVFGQPDFLLPDRPLSDSLFEVVAFEASMVDNRYSWELWNVANATICFKRKLEFHVYQVGLLFASELSFGTGTFCTH